MPANGAAGEIGASRPVAGTRTARVSAANWGAARSPQSSSSTAPAGGSMLSFR
jgi:hypothetical protein